MIYTLVVLISILALTLASLFGRHLYLELTTHFRLQYALGALVCIGFLVSFHSWTLLTIAVCCAVFNLAYLVPYYFSKQPRGNLSPSARLKLLQVNLLKTNQNYEALIAVVTEVNADVVVLQELTQEWWDHTRVLGGQYSHVESVPRPEGSGMALFSKYPLEEAKVLNLDASDHIAILARVNVEGISVAVLSMHPPTPVTPVRFANRNLQFREAAIILGAIEGPRVLIGDLNITPWSPYFSELTRKAGLRDARLGFGIKTSWPMPLPGFLRLAIDHCLVSAEVLTRAVRIGRRIGSDHRPLIVDVQVHKSHE